MYLIYGNEKSAVRNGKRSVTTAGRFKKREEGWMEAAEFNRLLKRIKNDGTAIEKLYRAYYSAIINKLSFTYGREIAEESAQEFFLKLFEIADTQQRVNSPTSWVYTCCENIAKRKIYNESRFGRLEESAERSAPSEQELYGDLYGELQKLDEESRFIIEKVYWEGYSQKEVAEMTGLKHSTVRQKHARAVKRLKKYL